MDCDISVPSIWNNTNRNIRRKQTKKKCTKENNRQKCDSWCQSGRLHRQRLRWGGTGRLKTNSPTETLQLDYKEGVRGVSKRFPPQWSRWLCTCLLLAKGSLNATQKKKWAGSTGWYRIFFLSTRYMANATITTTDTEVKHKKAGVSVPFKAKCSDFKNASKKKNHHPCTSCQV